MQGRRCYGALDYLIRFEWMASSIPMGDRRVQIVDGSGKLQERLLANFQIFKNTTHAVMTADVLPDYRCHQYSNLTYPLGIEPLGCKYSRLCISL